MKFFKKFFSSVDHQVKIIEKICISKVRNGGSSETVCLAELKKILKKSI